MMDLAPSTYTKNGDVHAMIHLKEMYPNDYVLGVKYSGACDYQPYVSETFQPRESSVQCAKRGATEELGADISEELFLQIGMKPVKTGRQSVSYFDVHVQSKNDIDRTEPQISKGKDPKRKAIIFVHGHLDILQRIFSEFLRDPNDKAIDGYVAIPLREIEKHFPFPRKLGPNPRKLSPNPKILGKRARSEPKVNNKKKAVLEMTVFPTAVPTRPVVGCQTSSDKLEFSHDIASIRLEDSFHPKEYSADLRGV